MSKNNAYTISFKKSPYNPDFYCCELRFRLEDDVPLIDILQALYKTDQNKLNRAFDHEGIIRVFVKHGYMLGHVSKEQYTDYLISQSGPLLKAVLSHK